MKAPEFTGFWFDEESLALASRTADEDAAHREQEALDDLAERVNAARSVY